MADNPSRSDLRLVAQAIRNGWEIPDTIFRTLPVELLRFVATARQDKRPSVQRTALKAIQLLMQMHSANLTHNPQAGAESVTGLSLEEMARAMDAATSPPPTDTPPEPERAA